MASLSDENSSPRQDPVTRAKLLPTQLDSPSRVTRSQVKRLSSAPVEAPMPPKPSITRKRSTFVSESKSDAGNDDEVSSVQDESDVVKPQRKRRSTRSSFTDAGEDGPPTMRGNKLSSIQEDSKLKLLEETKPVTRRTRASLKISNNPEPEISLPPTRRTRRSSISSVSSVTSSVVASPRRQTRSRKNLSPVPSPTFSEVSVVSEVPEVSPNTTKRLSNSGSGLNTSSTSITPHSAHASPALHSSIQKSDSGVSPPIKESSPVMKKSESSFVTPRQLAVDSVDSTSTKRSSLGNPLTNISKSAETDLPKNSESLSMRPSRRSHGRLSLSSRQSPLNFIATALEETQKKPEESTVSDSVIDDNNQSPRQNLNTEDVNDKSERHSIGRLSLKSINSSPAANIGASPELSHSRRSSIGRLSLSSNKSSPVKLSMGNDFVNSCVDADLSVSSTPVVVLTKSENIDNLNLSRQSMSAVSNSPVRESTGRLSWKSSPLKLAETSVRDSEGKSQPAESSDVDGHEIPYLEEPSNGNPSLKEHVAEEFRRSSTGRLSLSSNKSPLNKTSVDESQSSFLGTLSSSKTSLAITAVCESSEVSHKESCRNLMVRSSLSSNKSTPVKLPQKSVVEDSESLASCNSFAEAIDAPTENLDTSSQSSSTVSEPPVKESGNDSFSEEKGDEEQKSSSIKFPNFLNINTVSRRASTGNLHSKSSDVKLKSRNSMGPLINPLTSYPTAEDREAASDSFNDSSNNSLTISEEQQELETEMKISPIKQDNSPLKRRSLSQSSDSSESEPERQNSPNNLFEKSTVFDEMNESFGTNTESMEEFSENLNSSHKSPSLNLSQKSDKNNSSNEEEKLNEATEPFPSKSRDSQTPPKLAFNVSTMDSNTKLYSASKKVYKDAAFLLSGGSISDFDDDDDLDDWQPVPSPLTKSRKESRTEKKAQKKAEKEARKKARLEKGGTSGILKKDIRHSNGNSESIDQVANTSFDSASQANLPVEDEEGSTVNIQSSSGSSKRKSTDAKLEFRVAVEDLVDQFVLGSKESQKRKSTDAELDTYVTESLEGVEKEEVPKLNKRKSLPESAKDNTPSGIVEGNQDAVVLGEMKKKKKLKTSANSGETEAQLPEVLKKKKKSKLTNGADLHDDNDGTVGNTQVVKKKKRVKKQVEAEENVPKDQLSTIIKKKKKQKNLLKIEAIADIGISDDLSSTMTKKQKKLTKILGYEGFADMGQGAIEEILEEVSKKKKLKKKAGKLEPSSALEQTAVAEVLKKKKVSKSLATDVEVPSVQLKFKKDVIVESNDLKKKKKKAALVEVDENAVINKSASTYLITKKKLKNKKNVKLSVPIETGNASDSDDAPTLVSFSAGKSAALAELEAAAQSIKHQKELKRIKTQHKLQKIKDEKLAKMQKLKKKKKHEEYFERDSSSFNGIDECSSSSKIYFGIGQKNSTKRLPAELLESLSEQPPTKLLKRPDGSKERVTVAAVSAEEQERVEKKQTKKLARKLEKQKLLESDYVPLDGVLGATRFGVVPLRNIMLAKKLEKNRLAEEAVNFRQQSLFGNRIRRTPISSVLAHQDKLKASGKDRFVERSAK